MVTKKPIRKHPVDRRSFEPPQSDGSMRFYRMRELWDIASTLPVESVRLTDIAGFDEVTWFGGPNPAKPTCWAVADHAHDIFHADLSYPIILSPDGDVLDGWHRICKAYIEGIDSISAVRLLSMPPYRWKLMVTGEEQPILDSVGDTTDVAIPP